MFRFFGGVAVCRVVYPSIVRRARSARRPAAARRAKGPHDPSPRRQRRRRGRKRSRTVRALRGYLPNSPSTTEFPLRAWLDHKAGGPSAAAVDEKSGKRTTPPNGSRARRLRSPAFIGAAQVAAHAAAARLRAPQHGPRITATRRCGSGNHRQHDAGPVTAKRLGPWSESAGRGLLPIHGRDGRQRAGLRGRGDTFTESRDGPPLCSTHDAVPSSVILLSFRRTYLWVDAHAGHARRARRVLVRVRRGRSRRAVVGFSLRGPNRNAVRGLLASLLRE